MPVRVLTSGGRAVGVAGFDTREGTFVTVSAGAVILATGACGRLGLPASGYLYGTYENPTNAGDGYAMAYHAGAELSGIECFQINPLIKDYNGPACAYVANPFGGYQVNSEGERFVDCDYWSGQMMAEVAEEIHSARGPIYLKVTHLPEETIGALEGILHSTERPTRGTFHAGRGHDYRTHDVEMHISEIGLCGGHSASGVWVDEHGATTVPGLYAAGDLACVPHNYMIGAFVFGDLAGTHAATTVRGTPSRADLPTDQIAAAHELIYRPLRNPDGPPQPQVEYKLRRFVNDYVAPPKSDHKLAIAVETFQRMATEIAAMGARTPHELMRCAEVTFIRDCATMAARSSLARTESRWGLYHDRMDHPSRDDRNWLVHLNLRKNTAGEMEFLTRPVEPYLVPVPEFTPQPGEPTVLGSNLDIVPDSADLDDALVDDHRQAADSPRILELLALAEEQPGTAELEPYLTDVDPEVRRTAVSVLVETAPDGVGLALSGLLFDVDPAVRVAAAHGLRELVEVLSAGPGLGRALHTAVSSPDPVVRAEVLDLLRALRLGSVDVFAAGLGDPEVAVRLKAVHGAVSLDATELLTADAAEESREVRVAIAEGLAEIGSPHGVPALVELATDTDELVRAAALRAAGELGCPAPLDQIALSARADPSWRIRRGAVQALGGTAESEVDNDVVHALLAGLRDDHLDVRKAAVQALARRVHRPGVSDALGAATKDSDADVRAYARLALR